MGKALCFHFTRDTQALRDESNTTTQRPEGDFVSDCWSETKSDYPAFHLSVAQCHLYKYASRQQTTQGSCLFRKNTNCSVVLGCSKVCVLCGIHMVWIGGFTLKQLTDALSGTGAAPGLRVETCVHPCIPQWDSSTEVKRGTMNHKSPSDL